MSLMAHMQYLDDLIKEYLVFRGFTSTLKSLENDLKNDRDKGFRVDRITNQILSFIQTYDICALQEIWNHLDQRIFSKLSSTMLQYVKKLETSVYRYYVVHAIHTNKPDKVHEFFEKLAPELQKSSEWKEWFVLPYLKGAEDIPTFAMYFTRQWQDTLLVSLQNFLAIVFQNMKLPTIATFLNESEKITKLQEENELLRVRLKALTTDPSYEKSNSYEALSPHLTDFYDITDFPNDTQSKTIKNMLKFTGENSPPHSLNKFQSSESTSRRRTSKMSSDDKRRLRSSSLAPSTSSNASTKVSDHSKIKRVSQSNLFDVTDRQSRSPSKTQALSLDLKDQELDNSGPSPFLLISRESFSEHRSIVSHTVFNQTGTLVASADTDGVVKVWSPYPSPKTDCGIVMKSAITALEWLPKTEKHLLVTSKSATIKLFDTQEKKTVWDVNPESCSFLKDQRIMCVGVVPSEASFLVSVAPKNKGSSDANPSIVSLDLKTQKVEKSIRLEKSIVNTCETNHNGGLLICGCNDGWIRIVDLRSGDIVVSWAAHQGEVFTIQLSCHEDKIYSIGSDNRFASWSLAKTGNKLMEHNLHERAAGPFLTGMSEAGVSIDSVSRAGRSVLLRPYGSLFACHQNDNYVFTCSTNGPIIYRMEENSLRHVMSLKGHCQPVITLDWCSASQCGSCVSSSLDGVVNVATLIPQ